MGRVSPASPATRPRVAGDREPHPFDLDRPPGGLHPGDAAPVDTEAHDLAVLHDVDPESVRRARVAPRHRVVARDPATPLEEAPEHRKPGVVRGVEERHVLRDPPPVEELRVDPVEPHPVAASREGVHLAVGVGEVEHPALREHHVVVEVAAQSLPETKGVLVEARVVVELVVRAHDRGVAPGVAAPDPALLEHHHVADPVELREVVGGREPVTAAPDDGDAVAGLEVRETPCARPAAMAAERLPGEGEQRVALHEPPSRLHLRARRPEPTGGRSVSIPGVSGSSARSRRGSGGASAPGYAKRPRFAGSGPSRPQW